MCERCEVYRGTLEWIASHQDGAMEHALTLHYDMRGAARDALVRGALVRQGEGLDQQNQQYRRLVPHLRDRLARTQNECNRLAYAAYHRRQFTENLRRWDARTEAVYNAALAAYRAQPNDTGEALGALWDACREVEGE